APRRASAEPPVYVRNGHQRLAGVRHGLAVSRRCHVTSGGWLGSFHQAPHQPSGAARPADRATRKTRTWTPPEGGSTEPPAALPRRVLPRPGKSFREDILPGEQGRGPAQDLVFQLQAAVFPPQRCHLLAFGAAQSVVLALVGVGLMHPIPQTGLRNSQLLSQPSHRPILQPGQLNGPLTELRCVWRRHVDSSLGDKCRLTVGVRETGSSSSYSSCSTSIVNKCDAGNALPMFTSA